MINDILHKETIRNPAAVQRQAVFKKYWDEVLKNNITNSQTILNGSTKEINITNYIVSEDNKQIDNNN
jgi:hypothetical protein